MKTLSGSATKSEVPVARPITRELAEFAVGTTYASLPADLLDRIRTDALDTIAVGVLGHTHPWIRLATELWEEHGGTPQASLWGRSSRLPLPRAVLANGHAANSFEFDDTYVWGGFGTHQGNNVVPAGVGTAEWLGGISGQQLLLALAVGHEIGVRIMRGFVSRRTGWNGTALSSTFGAAATTGKLLGLNAEQMTWALGSAGSYVGGLLTMPPHSMVKRIVNGRAAEGGVMGALLAKRNFTGIDNVLEAQQGGFYQCHSEQYDLDRVVEGIGKQWMSVHVHTKRYPMCTSVHAPIEATVQLVRDQSIGFKDVKRVIVRTTAGAQKNTIGFTPETISSAQLSLAFGIATAVKTGDVLPQAVNEEALADPEFQRLMSVVEAVADPELDEMWKGRGSSAGPSRVEIELQDGRRLQSTLVTEASRMTNDEIEAKARNSMRASLGEKATESIIEFFRRLDQHKTVDSVFGYLRK
jgi:2-methylcitrate dehydratase PrpD